MASRITIHAELFRDPRFLDLCVRLGSPKLAAGEMVFVYDMAANHHALDNLRCLIPRAKWDSLRVSPEVFAVGLAREEGEHVYVSGAEHHNDWLTQAKQNGRKGGRPRKPKPEITGRLPSATGSNPPTPTPAPFSNTDEEGEGGVAASSSVELSLEDARARIPVAVMNDWKDRWTEKSLTECLARGYHYYLGSPQKLAGRGWAAGLIAWVGREQKTLCARPRAVQREPIQQELIQIPENTPEQLERARELAARFGLKIAGL